MKHWDTRFMNFMLLFSILGKDEYTESKPKLFLVRLCL